MSITAEIVVTADAPALEQHGGAIVHAVAALAVKDPAAFEQAAEMSRTITAYIKRVGEVLDPIVDAAHKAHKVAVAQRDALLKPAQGAKRVLGERMEAYDREIQRQRREAEMAAQRERERLEAEERERVAAEQRRLQAEADERALAAAVAAEAAGDVQLAERIVAAPPVVVPVAPRPVFTPPVVAPPAAVSAGISFRDNYRAEVTDLAALVKAVAAGSQPLTLLMANQVALNQVACALKDALAIPGVRAVNDRTMATRA